jgi:oxygen-independent coproporphyrinogen-3 oxidase
VPFWSQSFGVAEYRAALRDVADAPAEPLALYVHLPFCLSRCHYCGCNATVTKRAVVVDAYLDRVEREVELVTQTLGCGQRVVQLHLGGGTPNFLMTHQLNRLMGLLRGHFQIAAGAELLIECDPRIGSREQLEVLRGLGFNRVSFGVQDVDPLVQAAIGRIQPLHRTQELVTVSRELGFESVNLDLVYGRPSQMPDRFARTLEAALALLPDRLACFSYAHVPWMHANQKRIDTTLLPAAHVKFGLFEQAIVTLRAAGYSWIGLDHFARFDDELALAQRERRLFRNFMGYTVMPATHLLAFGTSAIGEVAGRFVQNNPKLGAYQKSLDDHRLPVVRGHRLSNDDRLRREVILHLMCNLELPYALTSERFGAPLDVLLPDEFERLRAYRAEGFIDELPDRLVVTELGRYFLRVLCMELDAYHDLARDGPRFSKAI